MPRCRAQLERLIARLMQNGRRCFTRRRRGSALLSAAGRALALARHLAARTAGFAEADRDCLFAAGHSLAGSARLERTALALAHRALDLALRLLAVLRHECPIGAVNRGVFESPFGTKPSMRPRRATRQAQPVSRQCIVGCSSIRRIAPRISREA